MLWGGGRWPSRLTTCPKLAAGPSSRSSERLSTDRYAETLHGHNINRSFNIHYHKTFSRTPRFFTRHNRECCQNICRSRNDSSRKNVNCLSAHRRSQCTHGPEDHNRGQCVHPIQTIHRFHAIFFSENRNHSDRVCRPQAPRRSLAGDTAQVGCLAEASS